MNHKVLNDLSDLTQIPLLTLQKLEEYKSLCISHEVFSQLQSGENVSRVDIGVGVVTIKISEDGIRYKFEPSPRLERDIVCVVENNCSPLATAVDTSLQKKIEKTYKDLL